MGEEYIKMGQKQLQRLRALEMVEAGKDHLKEGRGEICAN